MVNIMVMVEVVVAATTINTSDLIKKRTLFKCIELES
jgi:hypothetical protein